MFWEKIKYYIELSKQIDYLALYFGDLHGCGKTSLAKVISETTKYKFTKLNAVTSGVSDIKKAIDTLTEDEVKDLMVEGETIDEFKERLKDIIQKPHYILADKEMRDRMEKCYREVYGEDYYSNNEEHDDDDDEEDDDEGEDNKEETVNN